MMTLSNERVSTIKPGETGSGTVLYWMSRDQRLNDNWALFDAQKTAMENKAPLIVLFNLVDEFLGATFRQYDFMLTGLEEISSRLIKKNITLSITTGEPRKTIPEVIKKYRVAVLIKDFSPLSIHKRWTDKIAEAIDIPFYEVDAHNIVPCRFLSQKQEYAAYTIRPKIKRQLDRFLHPLPKIRKHPFDLNQNMDPINWSDLRKKLKLDRSVSNPHNFISGEKAAAKTLRGFITGRLALYDRNRNDPSLEFQSDLSPYLHFGQISAQRVALEVQACSASDAAKEAFLEELIVRRELSDNFCLYNDNYDNIASAPDWARKTLAEHRGDERKYLYSPEQFEFAETHDPLWNAAQKEMFLSGKMHGYMRMYWAKKILEWSATPEQAFDTAVNLNDKYELDGRDPNGYAGIAWSIAGVHDRAWAEREIFGKVRYMSYNGCRRKFDIDKYIGKIEALERK